jgi:hypothetical protein
MPRQPVRDDAADEDKRSAGPNSRHQHDAERPCAAVEVVDPANASRDRANGAAENDVNRPATAT